MDRATAAIRAPFGWGDAPSHSANYLVSPILELVRKVGARTILDAGCGNGNLAGELSARGYDVTGVDGDQAGIEIARRLRPGAHFETAPFSDDPPGHFDMVVSTEVIEHLYAPDELVRYCRRALDPGGMLVLSTPYHGWLKNVAIAAAGKWDGHHMVHHHCGHIKFFSRKTLTELLEREGFEVGDFLGVGRLPYLWKSMILVARKA